MDFLFGILIGISIGFLWGVWRATQSFIQRIVEHPEEIKELMTKIDSEVQKETEVKLNQEYTTEWHQGVCYLYDSKDRFMAQGSDVTEAIINAEKRFPGMKFNIRAKDSNKSNQ